MTKHTKLVFTVAAIVLLAAPLRLYGLNTHPPGLFGDEAADGLDALRIIAGERPLFLAENNGREAMHAYLVAMSVSVFGRTPAAVRVPSAIAGTMTVLGIFLVARSLYARRIGLLAALISAFTVWPIMLGRLATRPALLPLFLTFSLWLGIEGWRRQSKWRWALSGLISGAAFYTYTPIRVMVLAPLLWAVLLFARGRGRRLWPGAALFLAALALAAAPFANLALKHSEEVFGRTTGVAVVSPDDSPQQILRTLADQTATVLPMLIVPGSGDWNLRHNIPNRAAFDPVIATAFVLGMLVALLGKRRLRLIAMLIWIAVALLPTILSEEPPHFGRSSGVLPVLFVLPALGLLWVHAKLRRYAPKFIAIMISAGVMLASIFVTTRDFYLHNYLVTPAAGFWFDEQCTVAARDINRFLGSGWQGEGMVAAPATPHPARQVFIAPNVCPRYSSSGYYTVQFLVPQELGADGQFQRYDLSSLPPLSSLKPELLILAIPGDEKQLLPWLAESYRVGSGDGPWTPPDLLGNSWLVYRSIYAQRE
ncbi:MAG: glycosyltransferase family 39 protein [Anaerolineales bacterium]|jgi:4-amino-4-deoxy-L-arabinose transferase-like glycosyltransferase|nr:glycosyltransferase family 39 protein [Anaerolineales bacterium]MDP7643448.1 glycosyltransferase family 39 protein [Anaerolineales bacterium]HJN41334.1 glycosyltransferase family 39 protein [Anaerolineales bacterium]|tara:strand:- start:2720 stop:4330 length:1611 start_codon:yes stop_codon:yes gene_type:complete